MTRRFTPAYRPLVRRYAAVSPPKSTEVQPGPGQWSGTERRAAEAKVVRRTCRTSASIETGSGSSLARRLLVLAAGLLAVACPGTTGARAETAAPGPTWASRFESRLVDEIDVLRHAHHLDALEPSPALSAAAREHDEQMIRFGYFGHDSPDGSPFWQRVASHYEPEPRERWAVGENLLWASPSVSPDGALRAWLASREHRATLLYAGWRQVGVAVLHVSSASGTFDGQPTTVITADFGVRR